MCLWKGAESLLVVVVCAAVILFFIVVGIIFVVDVAFVVGVFLFFC